MTGAPPPRRKRIRLLPSVYAEIGSICSATLALRDRRRVFADVRAAAAAVDTLRSHSERTGIPICAFCVMPDHVHLVLGASTECDIVTFVAQFKNLTQRAVWRLGLTGAFWQRSFYDHFLREEERLEQVVEYVLNNPVRAGLVSQRRDYPFSGSFVFHL